MKYRALSCHLPSSEKNRLVVLTGARQTGKTTLAKAKYPELRYINLDAPENRDTLKEIPTPSWGATVGNAVIDEAQKLPEVFEKIKYAFDEQGISFTVLLGSSQILLLKKIRESLAGRVSLYELWPLLMSELQAEEDLANAAPPLLDRILTEPSLDHVLGSVKPVLLDREDSRAREAENHLLKWGGMPALLPLPPEERWKWLRDYQYTYLERDLGDLARLDDLTAFSKFQRLAALRSGTLLNYSELARDAAFSVDTARRYLEYLRLSYQVVLLQPYARNLTSSVVKTPKIYWTDIGLMRQLGGRREETGGEVYETMVVAEIHKWIRTAQRSAETYFYRTRSGLELDLLLVLEGGVIGCEIKGRQSLVPSDLRPMREIAAALKGEWRGGFVVYQGDSIVKMGEPSLWAIPARRLFT
jgi:predicted AAA+ superfamily ATPase